MNDSYSLSRFSLFVSSVVLASAVRLWKSVPNRKRIFRCVALDLDGTTLTSKHEVSDRTKRVLKQLETAGVKICICTGRSVASVLPILKSFDFSFEIPIVVYNGSASFVVSPIHGVTETLFSTPHTASDARQLIEFAERLGVVAQYYMESSGDVFAVPRSDEHRVLMTRYAELTGRPQVCGDSYDQVLAQSAAAKILLMTGDADSIIDAAIKEFPLGKFNIVKGSPDPFFVEFLPPNISKGSGLINMCKALNISLEEVIAFGDGDNDAEFLEYAGIGVAMKNAKPKAIAKADILLQLTNDEEGVAFALEALHNDGCFQALA